MMKMLAVMGLFAIHTMCASGGSRSLIVRENTDEQATLTGNLRVDMFGLQDLNDAPAMQDQQQIENGSYKSPWIAAGMSAIVPGAGELYAGSYVKAAVFLALDVAAWGIAYHFDRKGDKQTDFFQGYANDHWDVVRYAQFAQTNFASATETYNWRIPGREGLAPWLQVDWVELNRMERDIARTAAGQYYSHVLPLYGEQQYFELIGKYQQFYQGWDDANPQNITYSQIDAALADPNVMFNYYSRERGKANDYYASATTFVTVAIVNHIVSAADAAWSASTHNHNLHASVGMQKVPLGFSSSFVPAATVKYSF